MSLPALDESTIDDLYKWLSGVPLSKPIRNISKEFSDGVLVAELIAHFLPRYVTLSNFTAVNSNSLKRYNWETLNKMVFVHLNYQMNSSQIQKVSAGYPGAIEVVLFTLRQKIDDAIKEGRFRPSKHHHHRSRSSSGRTGSQMSLNSNDSDNDLIQITSRTGFGGHREHRGETNRYNGTNAPPSHHGHFVGDAPPIASPQTSTHHHNQQKELFAREEQIQRLVQLKDERIVELTKQVEKMAQLVCREQAGARSVQHQQQPMPLPPPPRSETPLSSDGLSSVAVTDDPSSPCRDRGSNCDLGLDLK